MLRLDLDADVEGLGRFALTGAHEVEVPDEPADRGRGKALGSRLVADLVVERLEGLVSLLERELVLLTKRLRYFTPDPVLLGGARRS